MRRMEAVEVDKGCQKAAACNGIAVGATICAASTV